MRLYIILFVLALVSCKNESTSKNSEIESQNTEEGIAYYGDKIDDSGAMAMGDLLQKMEGQSDEMNVKVEGKILGTCAKKGCWMEVETVEGENMMVRFKDYGFFVPTEGAEGKKVIMEGKAFHDEVSVKMLKHYAEDAGKSKEEIAAITEPENKLAFEATGVIIMDN